MQSIRVNLKALQTKTTEAKKAAKKTKKYIKLEEEPEDENYNLRVKAWEKLQADKLFNEWYDTFCEDLLEMYLFSVSEDVDWEDYVLFLYSNK